MKNLINWDSLTEKEKQEIVEKVQTIIIETHKETFKKLADVTCCGKGCCYVDKDREET